MQTRPVAAVTAKDRWPVDGMEINVVFSHELVETDVIGVQPPLLPFRCIGGGYTRVSDTGVEDFLFYQRSGSSSTAAARNFLIGAIRRIARVVGAATSETHERV